jgi:hypothetical protein
MCAESGTMRVEVAIGVSKMRISVTIRLRIINSRLRENRNKKPLKDGRFCEFSQFMNSYS